jgi:NADH-quinone oxidoreductase subunit E
MQVCTDLPCACVARTSSCSYLQQSRIKVGETTEDGFVTLEAVTCLAACDKAPMSRPRTDGIKYHENMTVDRTMELISVLRRSSREVGS